MPRVSQPLVPCGRDLYRRVGVVECWVAVPHDATHAPGRRGELVCEFPEGVVVEVKTWDRRSAIEEGVDMLDVHGVV